MTAQHLRDLDPTRQYATLVAVVLEAKATVIDEIVDLHDRFIGGLFNRAKRSHEQQFQQSGKSINEKVRLYWRIGHALLEAKQSGADPFAAIESVLPWDAFTQSVTEAEKLSQPEDFDYLHRIGDRYTQLRRYAPALLDALRLKAAPAAQDILKAVETLKVLNADNTRKVPKDAPTSFVKKRWGSLVFTADGVDRKFYELCVLAELKNALRSGDIWVLGSRQFRAFDEYLLPATKFAELRQSGALPLAVVDGLRTVSKQPAAVAGRADDDCQPAGQGRCSTGRHHHRIRLEDHATGEFRSRGGRRADAESLQPAATSQDHGTVDGSERMDRLQQSFHAHQKRRYCRRQNAAAGNNPG